MASAATVLRSSSIRTSTSLQLRILTATETLMRRKCLATPQRRLQSTTSSTSSNGILLHSEWVATTKATTAAAAGNEATADGIDKSQTIVFLHGLLGNGRNIQTLARKMCATLGRPGLLLDLRGHGGSTGRHDASQTPPTTFNDCLDDIATTLKQQGVHTESDTAHMTLVGHSLGGRLALQYAHRQQRKSKWHAPRAASVWLLDTVPGQPHASVVEIVGIAERMLQQDWTGVTRKDILQVLQQQHGLDSMTAQWLASSFVVDKATGRGQFAFCLATARDLMVDFGKQDFMALLKDVVVAGAAGPTGATTTTTTTTTTTSNSTRVDLVRGGRNAGWEASGEMPALFDMQSDSFQFHTLPDAGHWVHIDDLPGLMQAVETVHQRNEP